MSKVSVIIPCYNQGRYVMETLGSVLSQTYQNLEVIIVNDGSDDQHTTAILDQIDIENVQVLHTDNQGLAAARNNGIQVACGQIVLPLDSDDLIAPDYIERAVVILDENEEIGIVYCRAQLFGSVETEWLLPKYSLNKILLDNVIFCSALFRKSDWEVVGGYDPGMIYGWEDYDFWLSLIERGREVYQIPEILFSYRVSSDSMVRSKERWQKVAMFKRIFERHTKLFSSNIDVWIDTLLDVREPYYTSKLYIDPGDGISDANCISRKVELGTSEIEFSLEGYETIQAVRFDPIDSPVVIEILDFIIVDTKGERRKINDCTDNSIFHVNNERYFDSDDPQCFPVLSPHELDTVHSIIVRLSFKALAADALREIVKCQREMMQSISSQVDRYRSSGVIKAASKAIAMHEGEERGHYLKRQLKIF